MNNCFKCPYRKEVVGSAHSKCNHPELMGQEFIVSLIIQRDITILEPYITINEHGFRNGWAMWPINFDPVWITCKLPMPQEPET